MSKPKSTTSNTTRMPPQRYGSFDGQYVGGAWRHGRQGGVEIDSDPFSGEILAEIVMADRHDLDEAYKAAAKAQKSWETVLPAQRAAILLRAAAIMQLRKEELIDWIIRESGGTRVKAELEWQLVYAITLEAASFPHRVRRQNSAPRRGRQGE